MHDLSGPLLIPDLALDRSDMDDEENIDINGTRYEFGNTTSMAGNAYITRLIITELKDEDNGAISYVEVQNEYGYRNYTITYIDLDTGLSSGVIAGIVIGVILGVIVVAAIAFLLFKKTKGKKSKNLDQRPQFHNPEPTPRSAPNVTVEMEQSPSAAPTTAAEDAGGHDNPAQEIAD